MNNRIKSHEDLIVFQKAFEAAMQIFELSKRFPKEETYALTDQVRRASRSVCSNIAEAWGKRIYEKSFVAKLADAVSEANETQVWLKFAVECAYLQLEVADDTRRHYDEIIKLLISMIRKPELWVVQLNQQSVREEIADYDAFD